MSDKEQVCEIHEVGVHRLPPYNTTRVRQSSTGGSQKENVERIRNGEKNLKERLKRKRGVTEEGREQ
jgi:hypothetical protein